MIEADVLTYLASVAAIQAIVVDRVYPYRIPQTATRPLIVFETKGKDTNYTQAGESNLTVLKIEVMSQAETYKAAKLLAIEIRTALSAFSGTMGGSYVRMIELTDESDDMDQDPSGAETAYFKVTQDFTVSFG